MATPNRLDYIAPKVDVMIIELDYSIAAGSVKADVYPTSDQDMQHVWEDSIEDQKEVYW